MRKLIIRADDIGYSAVNDIGAFEALEQGVATVADVMLDGPHAPQALLKLREMPWISVGWHAHFWLSPVLDADRVPSLIQPNGRFRTDLHTAEDISYEEILAECDAQIHMCLDTLGRVPDTGVGRRGIGGKTSPFERAVTETSSKYGMPVHYMGMKMGDRMFPASDRFADRKIFSLDLMKAYAPLHTTDLDRLAEDYDPIRYFLKDEGGILQQPEDVISMICWHPGYLDWTNYRDGDYGPNAKYFTLCRIIDTHALCSEELKDWICANQLELVNFRDAFYGTRSYQNHLCHTGSRLYVG